VGGTLTESTVWDKESSPYIVVQNLQVPVGITLTLNPGVVVKPLENAGISVYGNFNALGTVNEPVVYTSIRDKEYGGDTGGYTSGFSTSSPSSIIIASDDSGKFKLSLSDGSVISHYIWVSDADGGRGGGGYAGDASINIGDPALKYDSRVEVLITGPQIDGSCSSFTYTGDIDSDFKCALDYARDNTIPVKRYISIQPAPRDWNLPISFLNHAKGVFSHTIIRYGGGLFCNQGCENEPLIDVIRANVSISDSTLGNTIESLKLDEFAQIKVERSLFVNSAAVFISLFLASFISIHNSNFVNVEVAARSYAGSILPDLSRNWWGTDRGPRFEFQNKCGGSWIYGGKILFSPWLALPLDVGATSSETQDLSVVSVRSEQPPIPVVIVPGMLGSMESHGVWVIDPILHTYDNLINTLEANGYVSSSTLFTFPYDWKNSNVDTALLLKKKIDQIKLITRCPYVDVVAHSMGGLVTRSYVQSPRYEKDVRDLIFLATPHRGAPEDYLVWEGGNLNVSLFSQLISFIFNIYSSIHGYKNSFDYIRNKPVYSIQELLPVYDYLQDITASPSPLLHFPEGYPRNFFLESLQNSLGNISPLKGLVTKVVNILGNIGTGTVSSIRVIKTDQALPATVKWFDGKPADIIYGEGDTTVPFSSASLGMEDVILQTKHLDIPTDAESIVVKELTGNDPVKTFHHSAFRNILTAAVNSFADILITSPRGQKVGKNPAGGEDLLEIPGAFYSSSQSAPQLISIPDPEEGEYLLEVINKGLGEYKVDVENLSEATSSLWTFSGNNTASTSDFIKFEVKNPVTDDPVATVPEQLLPVEDIKQNPENLFKRNGLSKASADYSNEASIILNQSPIDFIDMYSKYITDTENLNSNIGKEIFMSFDATDTPETKDGSGDILDFLLGWLRRRYAF
jgi:pimeloyl-ACP methyl ester carboxylesterase